jgi:hypothetical protein
MGGKVGPVAQVPAARIGRMTEFRPSPPRSVDRTRTLKPSSRRALTSHVLPEPALPKSMILRYKSTSSSA